MVTGENNCALDEDQVPDENCIFVPGREGNKDIKSSFMAAPFLNTVSNKLNNELDSMTKVLRLARIRQLVKFQTTSFCDSANDSEHAHDAELPNKQNAMCDGSSAWDIINDNVDFDGVETKPKAEDTVFELYQPDDVDGARVLLSTQLSSQMKEDYLNALKEAATVWTNNDAPDGIRVGINSFAEEEFEVLALTPVGDESRDTITDAIDALLATDQVDHCVSDALAQNIEVLGKRLKTIVYTNI